MSRFYEMGSVGKKVFHLAVTLFFKQTSKLKMAKKRRHDSQQDDNQDKDTLHNSKKTPHSAHRQVSK
jgi:hypothetical protein